MTLESEYFNDRIKFYEEMLKELNYLRSEQPRLSVKQVIKHLEYVIYEYTDIVKKTEIVAGVKA